MKIGDVIIRYNKYRGIMAVVREIRGEAHAKRILIEIESALNCKSEPVQRWDTMEGWQVIGHEQRRYCTPQN